MGYWSRNRSLVRDFATATARARAGAAFLDKAIGPWWDLKIDLKRLDIGSPFRCIAGQLIWDFFRYPLNQLRLHDFVDLGLSCGPLADFLSLVYKPPEVARSFDLLTAAWQRVILERRGRRIARPARPKARPTAPSRVRRKVKPSGRSAVAADAYDGAPRLAKPLAETRSTRARDAGGRSPAGPTPGTPRRTPVTTRRG